MDEKLGDKIENALRLILLFGLILGGVAAGIYGAWWLWPTGITEVPLSQLTLGMIGSAIGSVLAPFIGLMLGVAAAANIDWNR